MSAARTLPHMLPLGLGIEQEAGEARGDAVALGRLLATLLGAHDVVILRNAFPAPDRLPLIGAALGEGVTGLHSFRTEGPTGPAGDQRWHHVGGLDAGKMRDLTVLTIEAFPPEGGELEFVSGRGAVPAARLAALDGVMVEHDFASVRHSPGAAPAPRGVFPLRRAEGLLLGFHAAGVVDGGAGEAALLPDLMAAVTAPGRVHTHAWGEGDLIAWHNLPLMHRSRAFAAGRRVIHEVQVRDATIPLAH